MGKVKSWKNRVETKMLQYFKVLALNSRSKCSNRGKIIFALLQRKTVVIALNFYSYIWQKFLYIFEKCWQYHKKIIIKVLKFKRTHFITIFSNF